MVTHISTYLSSCLYTPHINCTNILQSTHLGGRRKNQLDQLFLKKKKDHGPCLGGPLPCFHQIKCKIFFISHDPLVHYQASSTYSLTFLIFNCRMQIECKRENFLTSLLSGCYCGDCSSWYFYSKILSLQSFISLRLHLYLWMSWSLTYSYNFHFNP